MNYENMTVAELKEICRNRGIKGYSKLKKADIIAKIKAGYVEVSVDNQPVVEEILTEINDLVRNLSYDTVKEIAESAEKAVEHIPFLLRFGCSLHLKCTLPNNYKYSGKYTNVHMIRKKNKWVITRIKRDYCSKKPYGELNKIVICLSNAAKAWAAKKAIENMEVTL